MNMILRNFRVQGLGFRVGVLDLGVGHRVI